MCAVELYLCDELTSQHLSSWPYVELTLKVSTEWPVSGTYNRQPATGKQETAAGTCLHLHLTGNRYWQQKNNTVKMESDGKLKCRSSDPWAVAVCASTTKDVWNWPVVWSSSAILSSTCFFLFLLWYSLHDTSYKQGWLSYNFFNWNTFFVHPLHYVFGKNY